MDANYPYSFRRVREVDRLTLPAVLSQPGTIQALVEQPEAKEYLQEVVDDEDVPQLVRFPVFHLLRAP